MKKYVKLVVAAFVIFIPLTGQAEIIEDDIVSWWSCDETSGVRYDSHGSNDLTDNNTIGNETGMYSNACDFDGASEYLSITDASQVGLEFNSAYTVLYWFNPDDFTGGQSSWAKDDGTIPNRTIYFDWTANYQPRAYVSNGSTQSSDYIPMGVASLSTDAWYMFAWAYDGTYGYEVYVASTTATDVYHIDTLNITITPQNGSSPFTIGANGQPASYFDGSIDEFVVFNKELSSEEIATMWNEGEGHSYTTLFDTGTTSTTTEDTEILSSADVTELILSISMFLAVFIYVLFTAIGYRFTKIFIP